MISMREILLRIKRMPKRVWIFALIAIIIAFISLFILDYFSYYFHELGHANTALFYSISNHQTENIIMNFTYINFWGIEGLKVPQQTNAIFPRILSFYGVMFSFILYFFIILLLSKIKRIKENKWLEYPLTFAFILVVLRDIVLNLFCGTDGLKMSCSALSLDWLKIIFLLLILLSLGCFFIELLTRRYLNNKKVKMQKAFKGELR